METRANHVWVGAVTLALLAVIIVAILWIARLNEGNKNEYDIFFKQSVDGLSKGSAVSFQGVAVGQVKQIDGAAQQWALENKKSGTDSVSAGGGAGNGGNSGWAQASAGSSNSASIRRRSGRSKQVPGQLRRDSHARRRPF